MEMPTNNPIVLLRESTGDRFLPIWVGAVEATAIAYAQQGITPPRPLTHDLVKDLLTALSAEVTLVTITELRDGVFFAQMDLSNGEQVSARPSDAIAIALRTNTPIVGAEAVLDEAGVEIPDPDLTGDEAPEETVEKFREFLDQVTPEDFAGPGS